MNSNLALPSVASIALASGTTGLHQPFTILTAKPLIFGRPTFVYLDAGESATRRYTAFLTRVPADFAGVQSVLYHDGTIILRERRQGRELILQTGTLP